MKSQSYKSKLRSAKYQEEISAEGKQAKSLIHSRVSKHPAGKENREINQVPQISYHKRNAVGKNPVVKKPADSNSICAPKTDSGKRHHRGKIPASKAKKRHKERTTCIKPKSRKDVLHKGSNEDVQSKEPELSSNEDHSIYQSLGDIGSSVGSTRPLESDLLIQSGNTLQSLRQLAGKARVPMTGNKMQLQQRIQWYDKFKLNSSIIDPVKPVKALDESGFVDDITFKPFDEDLQSSLKWLTVVEVYSYFLKRSARQGYQNGKLLKKAGFLRNVCYAKVNDEVYQVRCYCSAAMHKNRVYLVKLEHNGSFITKTNCGCAAGSGNSAACKHVGALLAALEEFVETGIVQQNETCTDVLQTWHRPPKNADKSSMYKPIKELYLDSPSADSPKINEVSRNKFTEYFMNTTLNAGLYMAVHRSRNIHDMHHYQEMHSYSQTLQVKNPIDLIEDDS